jgi:hypothetical protein
VVRIIYKAVAYVQLVGIASGTMCILVGCGVNSPTPVTTQASLTPPSPPPLPPPVVVTGIKKSIRNWATCDGVTDDAVGVAQAFAAAKNNSFILEVDCPVYVHIGMDVAKPIFVDNGTSVDFTPNGLLIVDNELIPAFVFANTNDVTLTNWNVEYVGSLPINNVPGGYYFNGEWTNQYGVAPSVVFNDKYLTDWMTANRGITFAWGVRARWAGFTDDSAIFYLTGSTSNVKVEDMNLWVPKDAGGDHYIPMAFALTAAETSDQDVTPDTPVKMPYYTIPSNLNFSGITIDGSYYAFQGSAQNMHVSNVVAYRYGDLQDANGDNVGGINDWFAPPHLFYLNYDPSNDPSLFSSGIVIDNVVDYGERTGKPRSASSGNCYSLKLGEYHGSVSNYVSFRPDGFMDVLWSTDLTLSNITASYDSSFLNGAYPIIRFPASDYHELTFANVNLQDTAATAYIDPIWGNGDNSNSDIHFSATNVKLNRWAGSGTPGYSPIVEGTRPYFAGTGHSFDIQISHQ